MSHITQTLKSNVFPWFFSQNHSQNTNPVIETETVQNNVPVETKQDSELVAKIQKATFPTLASIQKLFSTAKTNIIKSYPMLVSEQTFTELGQLFSMVAGMYGLMYSIYIAGGLFPVSFTALVLSAPIAFASSAILYYGVYGEKNYGRDDFLEFYKEESKNLPLSRIVEIHTWKNIFKYELISQEKLQRGFIHLISSMNFTQSLETYTLVQKYNTKESEHGVEQFCDLPHPRTWKNKFFEEVQDLSLKEIVELYNPKQLEKLLRLEVLTQKQFEILKNASLHIEEMKDQKNSLLQNIYKVLNQEISTKILETETLNSKINTLKDEIWILEKNLLTIKNPSDLKLFRVKTEEPSQQTIAETCKNWQEIDSTSENFLGSLYKDFTSSTTSLPQNA